MNIYIPSRKQARKEERGIFRNKRGKHADKNYSVEEQYSKEELARIANAVRFTQQMFPDNAIEDGLADDTSDHIGRLFSNVNKPFGK